MMQKNEVVVFDIQDLNEDGYGIGKSEGLAVFVQGALPGETIQAKIIAVKKNYAVGKLQEILLSSPLRVAPPCPVFSRCGGCTLQHLAYAGQLQTKHKRVLDCIHRIAKLQVPVSFPLPSKQEYHYRNKAAFPLQKEGETLSVGFYAPRSHQVIDIEDCKIQQPLLKIILSQLRVWIVKHQVSIYNEQTGKGLLRHILIRTNQSGEAMLVLVINGQEIPHRSELVMLFQLLLPQVKSILLNINEDQSNVILGKKSISLYGRDYLFETINGLEFKMGATSFMQVNTAQAEVLYKNLFKQLQLTKEDVVADLYCGIGTITLSAAMQCKYAYGIEIVEAAIENARFNARLNDLSNAEFIVGDACKQLEALSENTLKPTIIIVDPPRKGLTPHLIQAICEYAPRKIGYVSCDPATFARDLALFSKNGYHATSIQPVDMFPQTMHIECLTVLSQM